MITNTERIASAATGERYGCAGACTPANPECRATAPIAGTVASTTYLSPRGRVVP